MSSWFPVRKQTRDNEQMEIKDRLTDEKRIYLVSCYILIESLTGVFFFWRNNGNLHRLSFDIREQLVFDVSLGSHSIEI